MKVLAIMGSPQKRGNTYQVTRKVEEKMKQLGDVEFECLFLKDADLKPCQGCFACIKKGGKFCPLKDNRTKIEEMIIAADGVIFASPVYVMQVTWLMKVLIDRMAYICHRPRFFNQKYLAISTTGGVGLKETLNYLEVAAGSWGFDLAGKLGIQTPPWPVSPQLQDKNDKKIQKAAEKFYNALESKKASNPSLYMSFRIFKALSERLREYLPADYQFYKEKKEFYYDNAKVGVFRKITTGIILKIFLFMMRDNFVKGKENYTGNERDHHLKQMD
jgi:multimeric flavodoxin WrbA